MFCRDYHQAGYLHREQPVQFAHRAVEDCETQLLICFRVTRVSSALCSGSSETLVNWRKCCDEIRWSRDHIRAPYRPLTSFAIFSLYPIPAS